MLPLLCAAAPLLVKEVALFHTVDTSVLSGLHSAIVLTLGGEEPTAVTLVVARLSLCQCESGWRGSMGVSHDSGSKSCNENNNSGLHVR